MSYKKHRAIALALVLLGALLTAAACSDDDDGAEVGNVSSGEGGGDEAETGSGSEWDGETIDANVEGDPIATVTADLPRGINRDGRVPVRLDVMELERNGELVELVYVLTNEHDESDFAPYTTTIDAINEIKLVDQGNQTVYLQAQDSEGQCLCSRAELALGPGESASRYGTFAGLPDDLSQVDVHVHEFTPLDGVPVAG